MRGLLAMAVVFLFLNFAVADTKKACEVAKAGMAKKEYCKTESTQAQTIQCSEGLAALKAIMPLQNKCYEKAKVNLAKKDKQALKNSRSPASASD
jgi:hypothetical protein